MAELNLGARAYDRILKVSRTIADLQSSDEITTEHVSEAISTGTFDRTLWVSLARVNLVSSSPLGLPTAFQKRLVSGAWGKQKAPPCKF